MTRTLFLHLGMNKTGSTSIQRSFDGYDDGHLRYLDVGPDNHSHLILNTARRVTGQPLKWIGPGNEPDDPDALQAELRQTLEGNTGSLIVSGEFMGSPALRNVAIGPLLEEFAPHFDEIRAFAYIREPVSFIRSAMQQRVRRMPASFDLSQYYPYYHRRFARWVDALGPDRVTLIPFSPGSFIGGDLLTDFAARTGASGPVHRRASENTSFSAEGFSLLYAVHRRIPDSTSPEGAKAFRDVVKIVLDFGDTPFEIAPDQCRAVIADEADDIAWVEATMGQPLPAYQPKPGALVFSSEAQILDYAESLGIDLDALAEGKALRTHSFLQRIRRRLGVSPGRG